MSHSATAAPSVYGQPLYGQTADERRTFAKQLRLARKAGDTRTTVVLGVSPLRATLSISSM